MLPANVLLYGKEEALPDRKTLRAGPLRVDFEAGDLRRIRLGDREIIRRIYVAVRDANWGTVPGTIRDLRIAAEEDRFEIRYRCEHRQNEIHFEWEAEIKGAADSSISFALTGKALHDFQRNRIGFCVHHPLDGVAGQPCVIEQADGRRLPGAFPQYIAPHQPFLSVQAITHTVAPGVDAELRFEGEVFETEDHRNWTDANYKTYGTPLSLPFPVTVKAGEEIRQRLVLGLHGEPPSTNHEQDAPVDLRMGEPQSPLPAIGLDMASHGRDLSEKEAGLLKQCGLSHLRCDGADFERGTRASKLLGVPLEVAVTLGADAEEALPNLSARSAALGADVCRWLLYDGPAGVPTAQQIALARRHLSGAPIIAGSNAYFAQLNRNRPNPAEIDGACFSVNPQVHAFDNGSLMENCAAQRDAVASARQFLGDRPVIVSPVTLKMRFNPDATGAVAAIPKGELPAAVDPRQMSLFCACWTLGSLRALSQGGARAVTCFETTGWRGLMETAEGPELPEKFRSVPGMVFPVWHVLADVGEFRRGTVGSVETSDPLRVTGISLRLKGRTRVLLANVSAEPQRLRLTGLEPGAWTVRMLDEKNAWDAMTNAEAFRAREGETRQIGEAAVELTLTPYAIVRLDRGAEGGNA